MEKSTQNMKFFTSSGVLPYDHKSPSKTSLITPASENLEISHQKLQKQYQELVAMQAVLAAEYQSYRDMFDFAPEAYFLTDTLGNIQKANYAAAKLLNVSSDNLVAQSLFAFVSPENHQSLRLELSKLEQNASGENNFYKKYPHEWKIVIQPLKGDTFDVVMRVVTVYNNEGKQVALRISMNDITEINKVEAERAQLLIREQTNRSSETLNKMKGEFLAIFSHEFRTPMNAILGWAQMLRTRKLDEQTIARALETIERNAKSQIKLISDMEDISRLIIGKLNLNLRPLDLTLPIYAAIDLARPLALKKSIQFRCIVDSSAHLLMGNLDYLQQMLDNLLNNAINFTPEGGEVEISLSWEIQNSEAKYAIISISDTGIGIKPDFLVHIFDNFRQSDSSITRSQGGLGLGLAIVRHIVELHNGTITATSPGKGQGSIFTVKLPLITNQI